MEVETINDRLVKAKVAKLMAGYERYDVDELYKQWSKNVKSGSRYNPYERGTDEYKALELLMSLPNKEKTLEEDKS